MNSISLIVRFYTSFYKKLKGWIVPLLIVLALISGNSVNFNQNWYYIPRIWSVSFHIFIGQLLSIACLILVYSFFERNILSKLQRIKKNHDYSEKENKNQSIGSLRKIVNLVFYLLLFIVCGSGLYIWSFKFPKINQNIPSNFFPIFIHQILVQIFISVACLKYYLSFTRWVRRVSNYLKKG